MKPLDFVVIGAAKSGTTTLFHYLCRHPRIYIPPEKEIPYFSRDERMTRGWEWFVREFFAAAPPGALWGKVSPQYMGDHRAPERLFRAMPDVKLIALLRNPVQRTYSNYMMDFRTGNDQRTFEEVVVDQLAEEKLVTARRLPLNRYTKTETYLVRSEYGRILRNYLAYFPQGQLLVHWTDELEQQPQRVLDSVMTFLGLESGFSPPNLGKRYYVGGAQQRFPWLISMSRKIPPLRWFWKVVPEQPRILFLKWYVKEINVVRKSSDEMSPELRRRLVEFYRPDIRELEKLIGKEVPWREFLQ